MIRRSLEEVHRVLLAFCDEGAPQACAQVHDVVAACDLEARKASGRPDREGLTPFGVSQVEGLWRQGMIVNLAIGLGAGVVGVDNHRHALVPGLAGQMIQGDQAVWRQIVEQGRHVLIEQGQPVLHAGAATAAGDRLIERVAAWRAKRLNISPAEPRNGFCVQKGLAYRQKDHILQLSRGALGLGIKSPDGFQGVAKQVQADRLFGVRREHVDDSAADGELAALRDG